MVQAGTPTSPNSAIALFIFLGVILLFLPCTSIIIVKFRRNRNRRAKGKAEQGNRDYWTNLEAADALTKPKAVAQPAAIQRDAHGNKVLPKVYRNKAGIFERATLKDDGTYEVPQSFKEELRREPVFKDLRLSSEEDLQRYTQFQAVSLVRPPHAAEYDVYAKPEGRLLTPQQSHGTDETDQGKIRCGSGEVVVPCSILASQGQLRGGSAILPAIADRSELAVRHPNGTRRRHHCDRERGTLAP